jgi:YVTN family beta-propeller protein
MCYNRAHNKVYVTDTLRGSDRVFVIDGATNEILATVPVGRVPWALCYDSVDDKLYCANFRAGTVTVIDGASDSVLATVFMQGAPRDMCFSPVGSKIYCASYLPGFLSVVDGAGDSLIGQIWTFGDPSGLCYSPTSNKVYAVSYYNYNGIAIIDPARDVVLAELRVQVQEVRPCYNSASNKVYCLGSDKLLVVDGVGDSVKAVIPMGRTVGPGLCYSPVENKVYCAVDGQGVCVLDGASDTIVATVPLGDPALLLFDSLHNKVYCTNPADSSVVVIDGAADNVICTIGVGGLPCAMAWNSADSRVYVANFGSHSVSVIRDTGLDVKEMSSAEARAPNAPTIVRGVLFLPRDMTDIRPGISDRVQRSFLLDIGGRKVLDLQAGANDVRSFAPGVYFVREARAQPQAQATRKVVIAR